MGLGTGIDCKICGKQIYDEECDFEEMICEECLRIIKIHKYLENQED